MADRYWVGGTDNWSATAGSKWATTSGGAGGAAVPTAADDVYFDSNSGSVTVSIATNVVCRSLNCTGFTGTLSHTTGNTLSIGTSTPGPGTPAVALKFVSGMAYSPSGDSAIIAFVSTSTTEQTIDWGTISTRNVTFNGAGGNWKFISAHTQITTSAVVTLTAGTLDTNGQTCSWGLFNSSNSNARVLTLGNSSIAITSNSTSAWNTSTTTSLTISSNTAVVTLGTSNSGFLSGAADFNGMSVVFSGAGTQILNVGVCTFGNVTRTGTAAKSDTFAIYNNITITGTFTLNGNSSINRLFVSSNAAGTQRTITAAATSFSNVDFQDIVGAGAGNWDVSAITGGAGDCGGNSGITFAASENCIATGTVNGSVNWSALSWSPRVPLAHDNAALNITFTSGTITMDLLRIGANVDFSGMTYTSGTISMNQGTYRVYGSLTFKNGATFNVSGGSPINLEGRGTHNLTLNGVALFGASASTGAGMTINAPGGYYTLQDDFIISTVANTRPTFVLSAGTFDANGHDMDWSGSKTHGSGGGGISLGSGTITRELKMGGGTWTFGSGWSGATTGSGITVTVGGSLLRFVAALNGYSINFARTEYSGNILIESASGVGIAFPTPCNLSGTLTIDGGCTIRFDNDEVNTIGTLKTRNTSSSNRVLVRSCNASSAPSDIPHRLTITNYADCDWLDIQGSRLTGIGFAGYNSIDNGCNSGWLFKGPTPRAISRPVYSPSQNGVVARYIPQRLGLSHGDVINTLTDLSGNGANLTPVADLNRPTFYANLRNGRGAARFNGTDQWLRHTSLPSISQPFTTLSVLILRRDPLTSTIEVISDGGNGISRATYPLFGTFGFKSAAMFGGNIAHSAPENTRSIIGKDYVNIYACLADGASSKMWINGEEYGVTASVGTSGVTGFSLGSNASVGGNNFGQFDLFEYVIINHQLSAAELESWNGYFSSEYNIPLFA